MSTYKLVGPQYFNFFALLMAVVGVLFIVVAIFYKEKTHVRDEARTAKRPEVSGCSRPRRPRRGAARSASRRGAAGGVRGGASGRGGARAA